MSSTILYKFRSGTTFEALSLPGTAARLLDVKKAIVAAKRLDQGSIEFDLAVKDATTNEDYTDETMLLPRGTRVVVQRLPAARGQGLLARLARVQATGLPPLPGGGGAAAGAPSGVPSDFYTIDTRRQDEEDEFVSASAEDRELAALRAVTEAAGQAAAGPAMTIRGGVHPAGVAGSGPPPPRFQNHSAAAARQRPNADPELREQEKHLLPKKRATGIPRTFLNLSAAPNADGTGDGESVPLLQPNAIGFKELINRGGGLSELAIGTKKDLDYALKLTSTTIPEYLECAICHSVVRDAMMLPWDPEGRTTCDFCIRDALSTSGFRCPLTGQEGVSPDDLLPNYGLRKAAQVFINEVMAKIEEIEEQPEDDDIGADEATMGTKEGQILDGEAAEKGVLVSRKTATVKKPNNDPFGGDDLGFGGDVFAVAPEETHDEPLAEAGEVVEPPKITDEKEKQPLEASTTEGIQKKITDNTAASPAAEAVPSKQTSQTTTNQPSPSDPSADSNGRREPHRRRGPPAGYQMGPAGSGAMGNHPSPMAGRGFDGRFHDREFHGGRGGRGGGYYGAPGRFGENFESPHQQYDRGMKRSHSDSMDDSGPRYVEQGGRGPPPPPPPPQHYGGAGYYGRGGSGGHYEPGRGYEDQPGRGYEDQPRRGYEDQPRRGYEDHGRGHRDGGGGSGGGPAASSGGGGESGADGDGGGGGSAGGGGGSAGGGGGRSGGRSRRRRRRR